jgi:hypothetical protein
MAKAPAGGMRRVVVAGDVTLDWNLARIRGSSEEITHASCQPGGALLLGELIAAVGREMSKGASARIKVSAPEAPSAVSPMDERFDHHHSIWTRHADDERRAWRVAEFLGIDHAPDSAGVAPAREDLEAADLVVLNDAGLGFRERLWPPSSAELDVHRPWILLRMAKPVAQGTLWERLQPFADRMITVIHIDDLRLGEVGISRELSWERTAQELLWELLYNPRVTRLAQCAHLVVSFTTAGALVFSRVPETQDGPKCQLVFDPSMTERTWHEEHPGEMIGGLSSLTASIARQVLLKPESPDVIAGVQRGIAAMRSLNLEGYAAHEDLPGRVRLRFPTERIAAELLKDDRPFAQVSVPDPSGHVRASGRGRRAGRDWTILEDRYSDELELLAFGIVEQGPERALKNVPIGRFGKLLTVDRHEIEGFQSIRTLIREYDSQTEHPRPLSIAVFGPPGSGKSFGVKQVAKAILPGRIEDVTFNLSQFGDPDTLTGALHRVRDISLRGKLPLVFWDEFDTTLVTAGVPQPLGWLRFFLSPMQDGEFQDGQLTHPIGPAVFVFAGGTRARMQDFAQRAEDIAQPVTEKSRAAEEFRAAKGPDFVSRLKGYVNVQGPNPSGDDTESDPYYLIRRAVLLRSLLLSAAPQISHSRDGVEELDIDTGVLRGLLLTRSYRHGARSMESVIAMSTLSGRSRFERSALPSEAQADLHLARDFFDLVHHLDLEEEEVLERLAEAAHVVYSEHLLAEGKSWNEPSDDYLLRYPLLKQYAGRKWDLARADSSLVSYEKLPEDLKKSNRDFVRAIPSTLAAAGYVMRPARGGEPRLELSDQQVKFLAKQEHERWLTSRLSQGWSWAPVPKNTQARTNPAMLPWRQMTQAERVAEYGPEWAARLGNGKLSKDEKKKNIELIRGYASCLAVAGYTAVKALGKTSRGARSQ